MGFTDIGLEDTDPSAPAAVQNDVALKHRIAIVTTKQPGTNPRMRKNADALAAAGYDVDVLYAFNAAWADEADQTVFQQAKWRHRRIGGHPQKEFKTYAIQRLHRKWADWTHNSSAAFCPCRHEYIKALQTIQPHLVIGHIPGALPILSEWSSEGTVLFDAEDDHPGEFKVHSPESLRVAELEKYHLKEITHITAASPLIDKEYHRRFPHLEVTAIDNVFDLDFQPEFQEAAGDPLKFVWFSQVVGLDRGLQEFFAALGAIADVRIQFTIIGLCEEHVRRTLQNSLLSEHHTLSFEPPVQEKKLMQKLGQHHIGLAIETGMTRNRQLCRTNKLFCYPLSGCITLASNTRSQTQFMEEHPEAGVVYDSNRQLTDLILQWANQPDVLNNQRKAAWKLAQSKLNWEVESEKLVALVERLIHQKP